jgi:AraC family transcriptional regulator, transcriptional activator of pobA
MKPQYATIPEYTISDTSADAGRAKPTKDFHIIKSDELIFGERMVRPSRSNHFTIALVTAGECTVQINLIKYSLKKNSLFVIPPDMVRQIHKKTDDLGFILLEFTKDFLLAAELHKKHIDALTFFSSQSDPHLLLAESEAGMLRNIMLFLQQKDLSDTEHPFRDEVIHHSFNLFIFEMGALFKKYRGDDVIQLTRKEELLISFVKLLAQHFKEERSVQYYADRLYVTPKHLSKTVKEITDKTSGEFIDEMVISEAKILLDDHALSIGNVADALHFSDQFFFSKFFKNHTGLNPSEYRRAI